MPDPVLNNKQRQQLDSNIRNMLSQGATQEDILKYTSDYKAKLSPPVDPVAQQRLREVTTYLQNKNTATQDNLQLPTSVTQAPDVLRTELIQEQKDATFEKVKETTRKEKAPKQPILSNRSGVSVATGLQAKYGTDWMNKATPQEKDEYNIADAKQRYDTRVFYEQQGGATVSAPTPERLREQKLQKEADEFYNTGLGQLWWNVVKPIGGTAERIVGNTIAAGIRTAGDITGADEITDGIADYVSTTLNPDEWDKDRVTRITPTSLKGGLFNNGKINTSLIMPKLAETLTTMYAITQGGGGNAGLFTRSFLMQEEDYRRDGAAVGLKGNDLDTYSYLGAALTSALEPLSPNKLIGGQVKKKAAKEFYDAIAGGFSKEVAMKNAAKTLVKESALENTQEFAQLITDKTLRYFTDKMSGKPVFNDNLSWEGVKDEVYETLFLTTGATMLLTSPKALRDTKPSNLEKSSWYNAALNPEKFTGFINKRVESGELTAQDADRVNENFSKYRAAVEQSQQLGFSADQTIDIAFNIYKGQDISEQIKQVSTNPILKEAVGAPLKKEQGEITNDIKRIGLGVPEVGTEITGSELSTIIENIGDKDNVASVIKKVTGNDYRVEEINVKDLYENKASFKTYVENYDRKENNPDGLLVPAIMSVDGRIEDGKSRLAQQYLDGKETVQVFKELKQYEQPETQTVEPAQKSTNPVAEEIRQAIRDGKFQGLPVETANAASDTDLIDFIYDQATQTTNDPETGEPTTARPLLDKTFGAELVDKVIAEKEKDVQPIEEPATASPAESYESFLIEMMDFAEGVTDSSFDFRLDVPGMAQKERDGAIKDIRAGKETKRRKQFEDAVKAMFDKQAVSVNRGRGSQSEFTEIPFSDFFAEDVVPYDDFSIWQAPEVEGWVDQEITNLNNETGDIGQDETGDIEQPQPEAEVRSAEPSKTGEAVNKPTPQDGGQIPPTENDAEDVGFKRESGKKSLLNRAYEGTTDAALKERIAEFGLDYERQTWVEAKAISKQIIDQLGIEAALNAVRKGMVKGAEAAFIWSEAIDAVGDEIANTTDPNALSKLQQYEAELLNEFDRSAREDKGRFLAALKDIYENSNFNYQLSRQIEQYKERNQGEIPDEIRAKFEQLSKELEEANKKIAEREEEIKTLQEQQAMAGIKEAVGRETAEPAKKRTNKQKAKSVADAIRKGKIVRPGIFLSSSPASAVWDAALEATAKAIEAGGAIADAIKAGIAEIKKSDWFKGLVKNKQDEAEQTFNDYINETAAKEKPKPSVVNGKIQIPHELIRGLVESGIDNIEDLTRAVMEELKTEFPNITERQVRDAITNYGRVVNPNKEEVEVEIRKIKRVGRVVSALEDIAEKKRPLRSGLQRDKLDAEERTLQKELREALKTLPPDDEAVANKLKTTLDAIKSRLQNQIEDIEREISTGEKRVDGKAEVEYDAEAKALRERRDELKKVRDEIFGDEITDEQRIQRAIRITQRATEKLQEKIDTKDLSANQKSTVTSDALEAERKKLRDLRDEMKQLREQAGIAEQNRLNSAKKRTQKQIEQLEERLANKDFAKKKRTELKADEELIKLKAEKLRIQEEFNKEQYKAELKNRERIVKVLDGLTEVWGLTRVLMATGELSFILIQGGLYTITRPLAAFQSIKKMLSHFGSEKRFNNWERHIKSQPYYPEVKGSKLALSEYDSKLTAREELGVSGWANHIWDWIMLPVKGISKEAYEKAKTLNPLKMIERAGVSYMNNMRLVRFLQATEKLKAEGKTFQSNPEDFKNVADVINTFSGRASLGPAEVMSKHLALIFFSPRNWVSVIKQTIPLVTIPWYASLRSKDQAFYKPSVAQKMAALDYMKYVAATGSLLMSIAYMLNSDDDDENEVVFNPTSSDFLKVKLGNTRIDMFGGRTQMIVYQMRMLLDETTSTSTGKTSQLGSGAFTPTRFDLTSKMVQNKFAPTLGLLTEYLQTKVKGKEGDQKRVSTFGEEYDFADKLKESTQPIFWQTIREVHKDQPESVAYFLDVLAAIGTGIQTYGQKDVKKIMEERKSSKDAPKKPAEETRKEKREKREKELELREQAEKEGIEYFKPN